jgi:hypothetical protein
MEVLWHGQVYFRDCAGNDKVVLSTKELGTDINEHKQTGGIVIVHQ